MSVRRSAPRCAASHPESRVADHRPRTGQDRASIGCVIPCHNYAEFVAAAIDSVLNQTDPYDQIVVVDDGSTDDSPAVLARYGDRITIVTQENTGLLGTCLRGIAELDTDYVHVLDADDLAEPTLVERCRPHLGDRPVKVQFSLAAVDAQGKPNGSVFPSFAPGYDSAAMREDNRAVGLYQCPPTSGNIFNVQTLRRLPLDQEDPRGPLDGAGCAVMPYLGEVVTVPEPLGCYRLHGASMSNADLPPNLDTLTAEMTAFEANWASACRLLGFAEPPFGSDLPIYLLERRQLARVVAGRPVDARETASYIRRLAQSNLPTWQRIVQAGWMSSLLVPSPAAREHLVALRRNGNNRPEWVRRLLAIIRG
ncbi:glycosyltransferase family A protein [Gephyromycinifex aptenodytis]|uniref:glycosyltransferase family A protein n=1 Tax=Gephyromycinifex aptenodytis TaxID=2716227 RepID=UPI001445C683|nr:glycosyltransferase family A protein [Gephyromycinifex aptenodytis]